MRQRRGKPRNAVVEPLERRAALFESLEERRLLAGQPDLQITGVTLPASAVEGNSSQIVVSWTVTNNGTAPAAGDWTDAVYLSQTDTVDASAVQVDTLDERFQTPLAVGASYTINQSITMPEYATGSQFLVFETNSTGSLSESDTTNNVLAKPITINAPAVDLAVTAATVPGTAVAGNGGSINVSYTVTNQGTVAAANGWEDAVYISSKPTVDKTARLLEDEASGATLPLAAGASYTAYRQITIPDVAVGTEYLLFVTNAFQEQGESDAANDTNDVLAKAITVTSPGDIDLAVTATHAPAAAVEGNGGQLAVSYTVTNEGSVTAQSSWKDAIYLSSTPTLVSGARLLSTLAHNDAVSLAGGASYTTQTDLTLPVGVTGNMYLLFVTDATDVQSETSKTNNLAAVPITISAPNVDLAVTAATAPSTAAVGTGAPTIAVSFTVANEGTDAAQGTWQDAVYLSQNSTFDSSARLLQTYYQSSYVYSTNLPETLAGGASYTISDGYVTLPNVAPGAWYLLFRTNIRSGTAESAQDETNFSNNVKAVPITLTATTPPPPPSDDLSIAAGTTPTTIEEGNQVQTSLSWTVTNVGSGDTNGYWSDDVYLTTDPTIPVAGGGPRGTLLASDFHYSLAAGKSYTDSQAATIPQLAPGQYYLDFITNATDSLAESQLTNNVVVKPITITAPNVDLALSSPSAPNSAVEGQSINVSWTVTNSGSEKAAAGWIDAVYLSDGPTLNADGATLLGKFSGTDQATLAASGSYTDSESVVLPAVPVGQYYLLFVTNSTGSQGETNAANNMQSVPITLAAPDLKPTALSGPASAILGDTVPITWTVENIGSSPADGAWHDQVFATDNPMGNPVGNPDTLVGSFAAPSTLAAGASYTQQQLVTLPAGLTGSAYLVVVADGDQAQGDADFSNNRLAIPIQLAVPDLAVTAASAPTAVTSNHSFNVSWTTQNVGQVQAPASWSDAVYLSNQPAWNANAMLLTNTDESSHAGMLPGASYNDHAVVSFTAQDLSNALLPAAGTAYLLVVTNYQGNQPESDGNNAGGRYVPDANDVYAVPIQVQEPDLAVTTATAPSSAIEGTSIHVSWTVTNQGQTAAFGNWYDAVYLSSKTTFDSSATLLSTYYEGSRSPLGVGVNYTDSEQVYVPQSATGPMYLLFVTNSDNYYSQPESDGGGLNGPDANDVFALPITLQAPDLRITTATAPASAVEGNGDSIPVSYTVENDSNVAAPNNWSDSLYISNSPTLDSSAQYVTELKFTGNLAAGGTYTASTNVTIPETAAGSRYLLFVANADQGQPESDGGANDVNNVYAVPITLSAPNVDLAVTGVSAPAANVTLTTGESVRVAYTVKNQGTDTAGAAWQDAVYFSTKPTFDSSAVLLQTFSPGVDSLDAEANYTNYQDVAMAAGSVLPVGAGYLLFVTNDNHVQDETDAATGVNDVFAVPISLAAPDLAVTAASAVPNTAAAGSSTSIDVNYTVTNQSTTTYASGSWQDELFLSSKPSYDSSAQYITTLDSSPDELAPGSSYTVNQNVTLSTSTAGPQYLLIVTNATGSQIESDRLSSSTSFNYIPDVNDVFAVPITITAPDLKVTSASAPASGVAGGGTIAVSYTVQNIGTVPTSGSWVDKMYLSQKQTFDSSAQLVGTLDATPPTLSASGGTGDSYTQNVNVTRPAVAPGSYDLLVVANATQSLIEADAAAGGAPDANDVYALPITLTAPDLSVTTASAPGTAVVGNGGTIGVSYTVENLGSAPALGSWTDKLYISNNPTFDDTALPVATLDATPPTLPASGAAGNSYTQSANVALPIVPAGKHYLLFVTNPSASQPESDQGVGSFPDANDVYAVAITTSLPAVDLAVSNATATSPVVTGNGQTVAVSYTVTNQGSAAAQGTWQDALYLSSSSTFDRTAQFITTLDATPPTLAASGGSGDSYTQTANVTLPVSAGAGPHDLLFVTNATGSQAESDSAYPAGPDANDAEAVQLTSSQPAVDLAVSGGTVPAGALIQGQQVPVSFTVTNQGTAVAAAAWTDAIYLSTKSALDSSAVQLASVPAGTDPLAAGASYTVSQNVTIPATFSGAGYLLLVTNDNGAQSETNTANDVQAVPISVSAAEPDLAVTAMSFSPASPQVNNTQLSVTWTVKNDGAAAVGASAYWDDYVYLSTQPTFDSSTVTYLGSFYEGSHAGLAVGGSYTDTENVTIPESALAGNYYLLVVANQYAYVQETDNQNGATDTNNVASQPITIQAPDLKITAASVTPTTAAVGDGVSLDARYTVENVGGVTATGTWSDELYLSSKNTLDASATRLAYFDNSSLVGGGNYTPLAANASYTVDQQVALPSTATGNLYLLFVTNDGAQLGEADSSGGVDTNDVFAVPIDLSVPNVQLAASNPQVAGASTGTANLVADQSVPVQFTVTNNGTDAADGQWDDAVYYSQHSTLDSTAIRLRTFSAVTDPLAAGASYTVSQNVALVNPNYRGTIPTGPGYLLMVPDDGNPPGQAETASASNVASFPINVAQPDLTVTAVTAPASTALDETVSVSWTVKNQGSVAAPGTWYDTVYLSSQPDPVYNYYNGSTLDDLGEFSESAHSGLAARASYTDTESIAIPTYVRTGDLYLVVVADSNNGQEGADPLQNYFAVPIHVNVSNADLVVSSITAPAANAPLALGATVPVTWVVTNQGTQAANSHWDDEVFISTKSTFDNSATYLTSVYAPPNGSSPLAAGANYTLSANVTIPSLPLGSAYLYVETNANLGQSESNTANDVTSIPVTLAAPDLAISAAGIPAQTAPYQATLGQTVGVSWTVTNQGAVPAPAQWTDAVYISQKQTFDSSATLIK